MSVMWPLPLFSSQYLIDNAKWLFEGGSDADDDDDDDDEEEGKTVVAEDDGDSDGDDVEVKKINSGKGMN